MSARRETHGIFRKPALLLCLLAACSGPAQRGADNSRVDTVPPRADSPSAATPGAGTAMTPPLPRGASTLEGPTWRLREYFAADRTPRTPVARAAIQFENGTVSGTAGCNRLASAYTISGSALTLALGRSTMMACAEAVMMQEQALLAHWPNVASFTVENEALHLMNASGERLMTFEVEPPHSLVGTTWEATSYNNGRGGVTTLVAGSRITAVFTESGQVSGSAGCNTYSAGYAIEADTLNFTPVSATEMACPTPEGVMQQEAAYLRAMGTVSTVRIENDVMEWRTATGAVAARFRAVE